MIVNLDNVGTGLTFGNNKIIATTDVRLMLDGMSIGKYVTSASIEFDAKKAIPEVHLTMAPCGFPNEVDGKVFITFEDHTFECVKIHENAKV